MGSKYIPRTGETVRVVLEGRVTNVTRGEFMVGTNIVFPAAEHVVSIEKVEPPAVAFEPGQTVRHKVQPQFIYSIGRDGYYDHHAKRWWARHVDFTSADYELVDLK